MTNLVNQPLGRFDPDKLFAGPQGRIETQVCKLTAGTAVERGTLVTYIASTGCVSPVTAANQAVYGVAMDAKSAAEVIQSLGVYMNGTFNKAYIRTGNDSVTADDFFVSARAVDIFLKEV